MLAGRVPLKRFFLEFMSGTHVTKVASLVFVQRSATDNFFKQDLQ